jgi:23S rRNA pseudouridine1911/1915/1917 synthase
MAKPAFIELRDERTVHRIPILFEDRSALAVDKPRKWMLVPFTWQRTNRNLQAAISSSIAARDFWARSRNLKSLRNVHRLDADTTGVLLFAKSPGAARSLGELFESRKMSKRYLLVAAGTPQRAEWICEAKIGPDPDEYGRMMLSPEGKDAETHFKVLETRNGRTLIEAYPRTGRTHQLRLHLLASGLHILGDPQYGPGEKEALALRAVELAYRDPFTGREVKICAETGHFLREYGFQELPAPREPNRL